MGESLKTINIAMSVDAKGVSTGMKDAADAIKAGTDKIQTATETIATNTKKADESMRTLAQSYRAAFNDAQKIAESQGMQSIAFREAAAKAGEYKNKLDDVRQVAKVLGDDARVTTAFKDVANGVASGVSAVSGAMALFASDNKQLEEWSKRAQGAIALLAGVQGLIALEDSFKALKVVIYTDVLPALTTLGAALLANPVTAVASIIAVAATAIFVFSNKVNDATSSNNKFKESLILVSDKVRDQVSQLRDANAELWKQIELKKKNITESQFDYNQTKEQLKNTTKWLDELTAKQSKLREEAKINPFKGNEAHDLQAYIDAAKIRIAELTALEKEQKTNAQYSNKLKGLNTKSTFSFKYDEAQATTERILNLFEKGKNGIDNFTGRIKSLAPTFKSAFLPSLDLLNMFVESAKSKWDSFGEAIGMTGEEIKQKIADMSAAIVGSLAYAFGESLTNKNKKFGDAAIELLLNMFKEVGAIMVSAGIAMELGIITGTIGAGLIAGGLALEALAGAGSGMMASRSVSSSDNLNSAVSGIGSSIAPAPNVNSVYLSGVLYGNDILISTKKSQQQYNRLK